MAVLIVTIAALAIIAKSFYHGNFLHPMLPDIFQLSELHKIFQRGCLLFISRSKWGKTKQNLSLKSFTNNYDGLMDLKQHAMSCAKDQYQIEISFMPIKIVIYSFKQLI